MAQLKAGSTAGGITIKSAAGPWTSSDMDFSTAPGLTTEGYVKKAATDEFELVATSTSVVKTPVRGTVAAFTSGGTTNFTSSRIDKFPFSAASPFTATVAGALSQARTSVSGQSSATEGFTSGGAIPNLVTTIDKFPFSAASPFTATVAGALSLARVGAAGQSSATDGFVSGGQAPAAIVTGRIDKFPFSTPFTTATDAGALSQARVNIAGQSSVTEGFTSGGYQPPSTVYLATIDKFPFSAASPFTATSAGALSLARVVAAGQSSATDGFVSGGNIWKSAPNTVSELSTINKFPFSAPFTTATNVGSLSQARNAIGQSSMTEGFTTGGRVEAIGSVGTIDKFPFTAPFTTATNVGSLSPAIADAAGQQY